MAEKFKPRMLGKTGFTVGPLGMASSYGVGARGVEEAFERGVNYFYWGWARRAGMRNGLRTLCKNYRDKIFITIPVLAFSGGLVRSSVKRALRALGTDYIDGMHFFTFKEKAPWNFQREAALSLKEEGLVRHIGVSSHHRPNFPKFISEPFSDFFHIRYNAIHRGAEMDVFPRIPRQGDPGRPGVIIFTATSWRQLIKTTPEEIGGLPVPSAGDCYRFVLSNHDVDVCITGPANNEQVRHALDAIDQGPMSEEELEWIRKVGDHLKK